MPDRSKRPLRPLRRGRQGPSSREPLTDEQLQDRQNAAALQRLALGPPVRLPGVRPPAAVEHSYAQRLVRIVRRVVKAMRRTILHVLNKFTGNATPEMPEPVRQALVQFGFEVTEIAGGSQVQLVANVAKSVAENNRAQNSAVLQQIGINPLENNPRLQAVRDDFVRRNAALIKDIPDEMRQRIEDKVRAGHDAGHSYARIAKEVAEEEGIGERRAQLIARDQVSKLNGELTRERQMRVGIRYFKWSGAMDERERPTHVALQNRVFSWETGVPGEGFPGQPINCRCTALAVVAASEAAKVETDLTEAQLQAQAKALGPKSSRPTKAKQSRSRTMEPKVSAMPVAPPDARFKVPVPLREVPSGNLRPEHPIVHVSEADLASPAVQKSLADLSLVDKPLLDALHAKGVQIHLFSGKVIDRPEVQKMKPLFVRQGMSESEFDDFFDCAGLWTDDKRILVGNEQGLGVSTVLHELGHAVDKLADPPRPMSRRPEWLAAYKQHRADIAEVYQPGSAKYFTDDKQGYEFFAESVANRYIAPELQAERFGSTLDAVNHALETVRRGVR